MRALLVLIFLAVVAAYKYSDPRVNGMGAGWDILTSEFREPIFVLNSPQRADPQKAIQAESLPVGVIMRNMPSDTFHMYAEIMDRNRNIKDTRDIKVDGGGSFWGIGGSFSVESKTAKQFISKLNHQVTRVSSQVTIAQLDLQTTGMNLSEGIQARIVEIGNLLEKGTPVAHAEAVYLTNQILNLFGTHVIVSEKLGGIISKMDAIDVAGLETSVEQTLSASASAKFSSYFKVNTQYTTQHVDVEKYDLSTTDTMVQSHGGKPWKQNATYNDWVETLLVDPTVVGTRLVYILNIIREQYFSFNIETLFAIRALFEECLDSYYRNNYYKGCSNPAAKNYVSYANVFDDKLCDYQKEFKFGGLFTTSNNAAFSVKNLLTENFSCPEGYETHDLLKLEYHGVHHHRQICHRHGIWPFRHTDCHTEWWYDTITTDTKICISHQNRTQGMYFGGVYTNVVNNDITQDKSCPEKYTAFPIYHNYQKTDTTVVCLAPFDVGHVVSVPFGGMFSSQNPNYLVGNKPVCGDGFERHSVGARPVAELTYCVATGSLGSTREVIPPGYGSTLNDMLDFYALKTNPDGTKVGIQVDPRHPNDYYTQVYKLAVETFVDQSTTTTKNEPSKKIDCALKEWAIENGIPVDTRPMVLESLPATIAETSSSEDAPVEAENDTSAPSVGIIVGPIVGGTVFLCCIGIAAYYIWRRRSGYSALY